MQLTKVNLDNWSGCGTLECHHLHVGVLELNGRQLLGYKLSVVVDADMQVTIVYMDTKLSLLSYNLYWGRLIQHPSLCTEPRPDK